MAMNNAAQAQAQTGNDLMRGIGSIRKQQSIQSIISLLIATNNDGRSLLIQQSDDAAPLRGTSDAPDCTTARMQNVLHRNSTTPIVAPKYNETEM
jgi:hypothetical protein